MNRPAEPAPQGLLADPNLQIVFGITAIAVLGTFTVAPALPRIVQELPVSKADIGWVITVFTLPGIFLMPAIGVLADRFGRRPVVGACLALYAASGLACYWAADFETLLALRFLQGVGAAPLTSLNIAFISDLYTGRRRTTAMGYNQSVLSLGAAGFTALGGLIAGASWRYPFMLPLVGLPVAWLVVRRLEVPAEAAAAPRRAATGDGALRGLFRRPILLNYALTVLGLMVVWGAYFTYFPILMGIKLGQPPARIGLVMTAMTLFSALSSAAAGRLSGVLSGRRRLQIAFGLYAAALAAVPWIADYRMLACPAAAIGLAQGLFIPAVQTFLGRHSTAANRGRVMAFYGSAIRAGQTLGPLAAGLVFPRVGVEGVFHAGAAAALALMALVTLTFDRE